MIPYHLEYMFLLAVYVLILVTLFQERLVRVLKGRSFWISFALFALCWTLIEIYGLEKGMWVYSETRLCGVEFFTVPLEEYLVFFLIHLANVLAWLTFSEKESAGDGHALG